jgi:glycerol-3-phosphate dehydrogenase (NAD(P)+)
MKIVVAGAGAFGTALAIALAQGGKDVTLWARDAQAAAAMTRSRLNPRLPDRRLPDTLAVTSDADVLAKADIVLFATPAQALRGLLTEQASRVRTASLVACAKGIDLTTLEGPIATFARAVPGATAAVLTGPSFAADIAAGLPTALTLATEKADAGRTLQAALSTQTLRLYTTTDTMGAELGGALKNVIAIACGATIGAGLGDSARAALMTRGFAEMQRVAASFGADPQTLAGLSGLGDLALTCMSAQSRNYRFGLALGKGATPEVGMTVEGVATAAALRRISLEKGLDLPVCATVDSLCNGTVGIAEALSVLMSRPLKAE